MFRDPFEGLGKYVLWKAEVKWKGGWRLTFGGENDKFCDNKERLVCMVNDIIEELLDMEPKPETHRWTSTYQAEEKETLKVGHWGLAWELPFKDVFGVLGCCFHRDGKGSSRSR